MGQGITLIYVQCILQYFLEWIARLDGPAKHYTDKTFTANKLTAAQHQRNISQYDRLALGTVCDNTFCLYQVMLSDASYGPVSRNGISFWTKVLGTGVLVMVIGFVYKLACRRLSFRGLVNITLSVRERGMICLSSLQPQLNHSIIFGHLNLVAKAVRNLPLDAHFLIPLIWAVRENGVPKDGLWYLDLYPISSLRQILVFTPQAILAASSPAFLQHHHPEFKTLSTVFGRRSVTNAGGQEWKRLRQVLSPVFSSRNMIASIPICVEETEVFISRLQSITKAGGFIQNSYDLMMDFTLAILCRLSSGVNSDCQRQSHPLTDLYVKNMKLASPTNIVLYGWFGKVWTMWKFGQYEPQMRRLLREPILERWYHIKEEKSGAILSGPVLVVDAILKDQLRGKQSSGRDEDLDEDIIEVVADKLVAEIRQTQDLPS